MLKIAIVGQPNVGKSQFINSFASTDMKVGNYSGVTVDTEIIDLKLNDKDIQFIDIPGLYSIKGHAKDEIIARDFILKGEYDAIINIVDSGNLERNMALTLQLLALKKPLICVLNMNDEAIKDDLYIDEKLLSKNMGCDFYKISSITKDGFEELKKAVYNLDKLSYKVSDGYKENYLSKIKDNDSENNIRVKINFIKQYITVTLKDNRVDFTLTDKIDKIFLNKITGIPLTLFFMWIIFNISFEYGGILQDIIDGFFSNLASSFKEQFGYNDFTSLIADGVISGVGVVMTFIPIIALLFLGLGILEYSGYMSRVSYLLDGMMKKFGLQGDSVIPIVSGFGCTAPAYMAARTIKNKNERIVTMIILNFMQCSARLPVYILFIGTFFAKGQQAYVMLSIYIFGFFVGLIAAYCLRNSVFKARTKNTYIIDMPRYRIPSVKALAFYVWKSVKHYIKKAFGVILLVSILIWAMSAYPKNENIAHEYDTKIAVSKDANQISKLKQEKQQTLMENSYLGEISKVVLPVFAPLGFDWKMTAATISGLAAKEVIVSTMGVLNSLGQNVDEESSNLKDSIAKEFDLPVAVGFLMFIMAYLPCIPSTIVYYKEVDSSQYLLWFNVVFSFVVSWVFAFLGKNITEMIIN